MKKNINLDLQKSDYSESKVLIISTKWNEEVIDSMLDDCKETLKILKVDFSEVTVPGAFEIPFMGIIKLNHMMPLLLSEQSSKEKLHISTSSQNPLVIK